MARLGILKFRPSGKEERDAPTIRQVPPEEMDERRRVAEMRAHIEAEAAKQAQPAAPEPDRGFVLIPVDHDPFAGEGNV